jgi:hypothetical protein
MVDKMFVISQWSKMFAESLIARHSHADERLNQLWLNIFKRPMTNEEQESVKRFHTEILPVVQDKEPLLWRNFATACCPRTSSSSAIEKR